MMTRESKNGPPDLPVVEIIDELKAALTHNASAVLVAPPGAGKTTVVPLALAEERWLADRKVLLLAPRRLAARAAAQRMAALQGQKVGGSVGYRVRMQSRIGPTTRIEVITEGILTRMLQSDPSLAGVGLVIFDEFHERSLDADLGLALCNDIQGVLNEDLRLLVMSATLNPVPVTALLDDAPLVRCDGRTFPVATRYVARRTAQSIEQAVVEIIRRSVAAQEGNLLVFLPGAAEINRVARRLAQSDLPGAWIVAPLYGNLSRDHQDAAISPPTAGRHKIVLATAIAETSLTIQGIKVVIDGGLQRAPRFDPGSGLTHLVTLPVSRASADQRRGRAGRLGPGICYRLWHESAQHGLVPHNRPEILDSDLAGPALELALWGLDAPEALRWLDPPPATAFSLARRLLFDLGAIGDNGKITAHGRRMAALPLHPRLAHMLVAAQKARMGAGACDVAAILSERDPLGFSGRQRDADLGLRLDALRAQHAGRVFRFPGCRVDASALGRISRVAALLRRRLGWDSKANEPPDPGRLLAWAYPDRIARRRPGQPGRFLMTSGRAAVLDEAEPLSASQYLVAAHLAGDRQEARVFMAAAIDEAVLLDQFAVRIKWRETVAWDPRRRAACARRERMLGAIILQAQPLDDPAPEAVMVAMMTGIRQTGLAILPWTRTLRTLQARVMLLHRLDAGGGPWPEVCDAALTDKLEDWLGPHLAGMHRLKDLKSAHLAHALSNLLTWRQRQRLEQLAPTHIEVPSGSRLPIDYGQTTPVLAVRIQEMFGATATPTIAGGSLPILLHLLSPAGRPAQITSDLAGFWENSYPEVKKELKGRYPKHFWPDDPQRAVATKRTKPRRAN